MPLLTLCEPGFWASVGVSKPVGASVGACFATPARTIASAPNSKTAAFVDINSQLDEFFTICETFGASVLFPEVAEANWQLRSEGTHGAQRCEDSHLFRTVGVSDWSEDEGRSRFKVCGHHCVLLDLKAVDCVAASCQSLPRFTRAAKKRTFALKIFPSWRFPCASVYGFRPLSSRAIRDLLWPY
jgi:hypothetical protein